MTLRAKQLFYFSVALRGLNLRDLRAALCFLLVHPIALVRTPSVLDGCADAASDRDQPGQLWLGAQERLDILCCL
jgi:hypothetical protein